MAHLVMQFPAEANPVGGGGQPGWILKCKGWETDPDAYIYFTIQEQNWENTCKAIWQTRMDYRSAIQYSPCPTATYFRYFC